MERENAMKLRDRFISGKYDVIFQVEHPLLTYPGAIHRQLGTYSIRVVVPPDHPLATLEKVQQSDLKDVPLLFMISSAASLEQRNCLADT